MAHLRVVDSEKQKCERIGVVKVRPSADVPILNQLREQLAKGMTITIV
jgi:hypothetical protein